MQIAAAEAYRLWAPTYDASPNPLLDLEFDLVSKHLGPIAGKTFVDIGCGTGRWSEVAHDLGAHVVGVDLSHEMLLQAASKRGLAKALIRADAASLPLDSGIADVVLSSLTISYLSSPLHGFACELARICRSGARILVADLHPAAEAAGWKRTFRHTTQTYELAHTPHSTQQLLAGFAAAGLVLDRQVAAQFNESHFETLRRAGKQHEFAGICRIPAVWLGIWSKA